MICTKLAYTRAGTGPGSVLIGAFSEVGGMARDGAGTFDRVHTGRWARLGGAS